MVSQSRLDSKQQQRVNKQQHGQLTLLKMRNAAADGIHCIMY